MPKQHVRKLMARNKELMKKLKTLIKSGSDPKKELTFFKKPDLEELKQMLKRQKKMQKEFEKLEKQF